MDDVLDERRHRMTKSHRVDTPQTDAFTTLQVRFTAAPAGSQANVNFLVTKWRGEWFPAARTPAATARRRSGPAAQRRRPGPGPAPGIGTAPSGRWSLG